MVKILIANQNIEQDLNLCQCLENFDGLKMVTTKNGLSTIKNILRLDLIFLYCIRI